MISLVPFRAEHVFSIKPRGVSDVAVMARNAVWTERSGPAWSGVADGRAVGCGGVQLIWAGVGEAWSLFGENACRYPFFMHRIARRVIADAWTAFGLHRLQAHSFSIRDAAWLARLGFEYEHTVEKFGPGGEDADLYAIIRR